MRRFDGTKLLAHEPKFQEKMDANYHAPFWGMHRVDLQRALAARAKELGVIFRLNSKVTGLDLKKDAEGKIHVVVNGSEKVKGDVVMCADGLWSTTRSAFLGYEKKAMLTGDLAYRIVINIEDLQGEDAEELRDWVKKETVNFWVGPGTHVVAYTMRAGTVFNIVLLCPDDLPEGISKTDGDLEEMKALFDGWDPVLRKFLNQVKVVAKWKLMWLDTLPEWTNTEGTFVMAGE